MAMKILIAANSVIADDIEYSAFDKVICCDGGLMYVQNDVIPDAIIGDFDSVDEKELGNFKNKSEIVFKNNQDESDLSFALKYCLNYNPSEIVITGAISSDRFDHSFCNALLLKQIPAHIKAKITTNTQDIFYVKQNKQFLNNVGKTVSIIPLTNCERIQTNGLKWEINGSLNFGFINGISNVIISKNATISVKNGELLVIIEK